MTSVAEHHKVVLTFRRHLRDDLRSMAGPDLDLDLDPDGSRTITGSGSEDVEVHDPSRA